MYDRIKTAAEGASQITSDNPAATFSLRIHTVATLILAPCLAVLVLLSTTGWNSPDSTIAFMSDRDGYRHVFLFDTRTGAVAALTRDDINYGTFSWLPDGDHMLVQTCESPPCDNWLLNLLSHQITPVDEQPTGQAWIPLETFSPDRSHVVSTAMHNGNWEIVVIDLNGGSPARLTDNIASDNSPVWSPDGQHIAFVSNRDGNSEIYVMNSDGSNQHRLTVNTCSDAFPEWSSDSRSLLFTSDCTGRSQIYSINPDGTDLHRLITSDANDSIPSWRP